MSKDKNETLIAFIYGLLISFSLLFIMVPLNLPETFLTYIIRLIIFGVILVFLDIAGGLACLPAAIIYHAFFIKDLSSILDLLKIFIIIITIVISLSIGYLRKKHQTAKDHICSPDTHDDRKNKWIDSFTKLNTFLALPDCSKKLLNKDSAIIVIQIDNLEHFNNSYGCKTVDFIIASLANSLTFEFGKESCFRYDEDKFVILLENKDENFFSFSLQEIQKSLRFLSFEGNDFMLTITIGYCYGKASTYYELEEMQYQAGLNLYYAKSREKGAIIGSKYINSTKL